MVPNYSDAVTGRQRVGVDMVMVDLVAIKRRPNPRNCSKRVIIILRVTALEQSARMLQPDRQNPIGDDVHTNFLIFAERSRLVDEFLLGLILYFRFLFRLERAERTKVQLTGELREECHKKDPLRGVNNTADIWRDVVLEQCTATKDRRAAIQQYSKRTGTILVALGSTYAQLISAVCSHDSKECTREKLFFSVCFS
jgi:hypothetical protein